jgi:hypothetical protein
MAALDQFTPRSLTTAINEIPAVVTFLRSLVFKTPRQSFTEVTDLEIVTGKRRVAHFVSAGREAIVVDKKGMKIISFRIPQIREKKPFQASKLLREKSSGVSPYVNAGDLQAAAQQLAATELQEFKDAYARTGEMMCAQALAGKITITKDDGDLEVDFALDSDHKPTLTTTARWGQSAANIIKNLRDWKKLIAQTSGYAPDTVILGTDAATLFLQDEKVQKMLDLKNVQAGLIVLDASNPQFLGAFMGLKFYQYDEGYVNDAGTFVPFVGTNACIMVATGAPFNFWNGPIDDLDAGLVPKEFFSKTFRESDPSIDWLLAATAPLPMIHNANALVSATIAG